MKNNLKKAFALFAIVGAFALVSCQQDEFEDVVTDPDPVNTDTIPDPTDTTDTVSPGECTGTIILIGQSGNPVDTSVVTYFNNVSGSAALFNPLCDGTSTVDSTMNYCVVYSNTQSWTSSGVQIGWSGNGIQGFEFVSSTPFEVGGTYQLVGDFLNFPTYVTVQGMGLIQVYQIFNGQVMLTEVGDEVGENITGVFTGTTQLPDGSMTSITGGFCVPITSECQ